jgi:hypothetical protein
MTDYFNKMFDKILIFNEEKKLILESKELKKKYSDLFGVEYLKRFIIKFSDFVKSNFENTILIEIINKTLYLLTDFIYNDNKINNKN